MLARNDIARQLMPLLVIVAVHVASVRAEEKVTYDDHVAPIFRQRCGACHNPTNRSSDLDVTTYFGLMQGGASGAGIEPGDASASYLFSLVTHESEPYMPQNADKLPDAEIELLRRWIDGGALENAGSKAVKPKTKMSVAVELDPGKRPDVVPLPPRMVLEPFFQAKHQPMARSLATSPWAPLVAVTSQRQVLLYNTSTGELVGVLPFPEGQPHVVRFSRDGQMLLAGGGRPAASGKVVIWDVTTGERVVEVGDELDVVLAADISADHTRVALGGPQRLVRVYSTETGELLHEHAKHTEWVLAVEFSPDGVLLATSDRNGGLVVWETHSGNEYATLNGHSAAVTALSWRVDSNVLASGSEDGTVRLWELENGTQVKNWNAKTAVLSLDFTRDGRLVTCGRDQIARLWDQAGQQLMETPPLGDVAVSVAYCDESSQVLAAAWSGGLNIYKPDDATLLSQLPTNPPTLEQRLATALQAVEDRTQKCRPLREAVAKAEAELSEAQKELTEAQSASAALAARVSELQSQVSELQESRTEKDAERAKIAESLAQLQAAHPLVAESLRHLTEALGQQQNDAELTAVQSQLTEKLASMKTQMDGLQRKLAELAPQIANADEQFAQLGESLEKATTEAATSGERTAALETKSAQLAEGFEAARKALQPVEAELQAATQAVARWQDEIQFRDQMEALQAELEAARTAADERRAAVETATEQLATAQAAVEAAQSEADAARRQLEEVESKIRAARDTDPPPSE